ncbi:MAG: DUF4430 domain-containing protein [Oscillospiraceae bacterium]|nr:DUF4430 domain-containing protein [Oscillospiraceae bacterium]
MKKIIALVLVLMMVLSFAACGAKPTAKFVISDGVNGETLYEFDAEIEEGKTAGAIIEEYLTENGIDYTIYDGDMISEINGLVQDDVAWTVYWACYYNGEYATVGLWGYIPAEGDVIEVKYEKSTW